MAHTRQKHDNRTDDELAKVELTLAPPSVLPEPAPTLEAILPPETYTFCVAPFLTKTLPGLLTTTVQHSPEPIVVPALTEIRPLIWLCQGGTSGEFSSDPAWRRIFGVHGDSVQGRLRSVWSSVREWRKPAAEQHPLMADLLAGAIVERFAQAAAQQRARLVKQAAAHGPSARAQAAHAVLEALPSARLALAAFDAAMTDSAGHPFNSLLNGLDEAERIARECLA